MATLQFKRGSTANLQNILPAAGEPVWDKELQKLKVGDGVNLYSELPYVGDVQVDNHSVTINDQNQVSLFNFDYAEPGMAPVVNDLRLLNWKKVITEDNLEEIIAEIEGPIQEQIADIHDDIAEVSGKVDTLDGRIDNIVDNIIPTITDELIDVQNQATQNHADIDEIKAELEDIHPEDIQAAIDKVETFDGQLDLIEDSLSEIQEKDNQQDERLDALEAKNNEQDQKIEALEGKVDDKLAEVDTKLEVIDSRLDSLENSDQEQDATLEDHEERLEALENGEIDTSKIYTTDDIMVIYGGSSSEVMVNAHQYEGGE